MLSHSRGFCETDLFEGPFYFYTLSPRHSWVGQTIPCIASPGDFNPLLPKVAECFGHHLDSIVGQGRCILKRITYFIRMGEIQNFVAHDLAYHATQAIQAALAYTAA